jgi:hypothetical protein
MGPPLKNPVWVYRKRRQQSWRRQLGWRSFRQRLVCAATPVAHIGLQKENDPAKQGDLAKSKASKKG